MNPENLEVVFVSQGQTERSQGEGVGGGISGRRLAELAGIQLSELQGRYRCVNLVESFDRKAKFDMATARKSAAELDKPGVALVLLGATAAKAFGMHKYGPMDWRALPGGAAAAMIPHPSPLNLAYNSADTRAQVAGFLRETLKANHGKAGA